MPKSAPDPYKVSNNRSGPRGGTALVAAASRVKKAAKTLGKKQRPENTDAEIISPSPSKDPQSPRTPKATGSDHRILTELNQAESALYDRDADGMDTEDLGARPSTARKACVCASDRTLTTRSTRTRS